VKKTKIFISAIPFLGKRRLADGTLKDMLEPVLYKPVGNPKLEYGGETRFPIVPVISGFTDSGDAVRVIAVITDGDKSNAKNTAYNYRTYFEPEIKKICRAKELEFDSIKLIHTPDNESIDAQLKLFSDIADAIHPGDEVYACISYGTKPMPIVLTMALNYAYKLKKDVSIGCIVYGRFPHLEEDQGKALIYDTTSLFYMDSIVNKLAEIKAEDPAKAVRLMLGLEAAEDV
jgi:hypothetical protein